METKVRTKILGFTLIELLVVIVIISSLSAISTATFKFYFGKARDAERAAAVQNIALMIKVNGADDWDNTKYIYDSTTTTLDDLFASNDYRIPRVMDDICYIIAMAQGSDGTGDDNEFVVATWGESKSIVDSKNEGVIADGTQVALRNVTTSTLGEDLTVADFACNGAGIGSPAVGGVQAAFINTGTAEEIVGVQDPLFINENGNVVEAVGL